MLLPRKWALGLGLLAATPALTLAGPFDFAPSKSTPPAATATEGAAVSNQEVAQDIAKALGKARLVHKNVQIEFKSGVARISGEIKDASQKAQVTEIVSKVPRVQSVSNELSLMTAAGGSPGAVAQAMHEAGPGGSAGQVQRVNHDQPLSNQQMAQQIANSLGRSGLSGYDIEVRFKGGQASLIGTVDDAEQIQRAARAAMSVPGVEGVLNKLATPEGQTAQASYQQGPQFGAPQMPGPPQGYAQQGYAPQQYAHQPPMGGYAPQQPPMGGYPPQQQGYPVQQMQGYAQPGPGMPQYAHGQGQQVGHHVYNQPNLPQYAWPSYAQYDNYAAVTYPKNYDASAWPYIGPYYPYPQVPMEWREASLEWDDGYWNLKFESRTDKWWWFLNPHNWD